MKSKLILATAMAALTCATATAQVTLDIDAGSRGTTIGDRHYGIFFEEINHAGDGGIYAELVRNRSFEDSSTGADYWTAVGSATMALCTDGLLNDAQDIALMLTMSKAGDGVRNEGFWGINVEKGVTYSLTLWMKADTEYKGTLTAALQTSGGTSLGSTDISLDLGTEWTKLTATITATGSDTGAYLALTGSTAGTVMMDVVSLFPPTYKDRDNGCRKDLAQMLEAMSPRFMRFPGGCYVEGTYNSDKNNRFEWKKTIGPIEERPGHMNVNWGYRVSDGLGFHEMLQLCEDLGAEPLFVVNIGLGHYWYEEYSQIDEYIQEALDALEYCNGDSVTSTWGALRAANGHPEPFNLKLIEVGNENYNYTSDGNDDQSDHYAERYEQFRKAIREAYPDVTIIGNVQSWSTDDPTWRNSSEVDVVDEHYYRYPSWFVSQYNKYDTYSRASHDIYVGEYAVTSDYGTYGNLNAALGEAVFMLGMENNSDICVMNSYAPIFVNENNAAWMPDMIRFNSHTAYGTPSYYVQQLFPNNVGKQNVTWTETGNTDTGGYAGLSTWQTAATFDNVKITDADGNVLFSDDFSSASGQWTDNGGTWAVSASGKLTQTSTSMTGSVYVCQVETGSSYTLEVDATKMSGAEGFLIAFNYADANNYCWWNIGGWGNTAHAIERCSAGSKTTLTSTSGSITTGQTYALKIVVDGNSVQCYMDGELIHDVTLPSDRKVYVSANINDDEDLLYLKMVNPSATAQTVTINLKNATATGAEATVMAGTSGSDENSLSSPTNVAPTETTLSGVSGTSFTYDVAAYSLNILRIGVTDVTLTEEETATVPDALVQYTFEVNDNADDTGTYQGALQGGAAVVEMKDGNRALYTGTEGEGGYMDLGATMGQEILAKLDGDYTISLALALPDASTLDAYCWAYEFSYGTTDYIGMVNTTDNTSWYYTIAQDGSSYDVTAGGGLSYGKWHLLTYVQNGTTGSLYVDGCLTDKGTVTISPADIASTITAATLGHSPFEADGLLTEVFMDNFRIYGSALTQAQVKALYAEVADLEATAPSVTQANNLAEMGNYMKLFNCLHSASTTLPDETDEGTALTWTLTLDSGMEGYATLSGTTLTVNSRPTETLTVGTLTATTADGLTFSQRLTLAPDDNRYGYLYCYMNSDSEITNYALGTKDDKGHVFNELLDGAEIFDTDALAQIEQGTRDAFIGRGQTDGEYYITVTDMCNATSGVWNNYGIDLLRSSDMIHWEGTTFKFTDGKGIFSDSSASTGVYDSDEEYANITRVWAPQFIWDQTYNNGQGAYMVYYSILSSNDGDTYDRIFYSHTTDFKTLTQPRLFFDPGISVIDADIVYNPYDGLYHMYYKREEATGSDRGIYEATSATLTDGTWTEVMHMDNEGSYQVEGSSTIRRINEDAYNLYYMRYSGGNAYKYCETDHMGLNASLSATLGGTGDFQHGSFLTLTEEEYTMLQAWSDVTLLLPSVQSLAESTGAEAFSEAVAVAEQALALTSVSELATALPAALQTLKGAYAEYLTDLAAEAEGEVDITFMLTNADFSDGDTGWNGTDFTQAPGTVAEFWNKTYDMWQTLEDMPAGTYRLEVQGFYRYGSIATAYTAHSNGTELLLAKLYLNDETSDFMSLFGGTTTYTYSPYTYPNGVDDANTAFNTYGYYTDNTVSCTLDVQGDLTVGLRKTVQVSDDWNCFDNFHLYYTPLPTGIEGVTDGGTLTANAPVDVYTLSGVKVKTHVTPSSALQGLPRGIYIVGTRKMLVK